MELSDFLNKLTFPAFLVQDGQITHVNIPALQRNITTGSSVAELITFSSQEYQEFTHGKLCLTLEIDGISYQANVSIAENAHLFSLETEYDDPQLRVLALAAQQMRGPLADAFAGTEMLSETVSENDETKAQLAQVNRSLYRLLRMVSNMSDTALYNAEQMRRLETVDLVNAFDELLEKASALAEKANKKLTYTLPDKRIYSLADMQKLERAILNMLSNALRFSPADSEITAKLVEKQKRLYFTLENQLSDTFSKEPFFRYLRQPGIELSQSGIGLGLSIIRSVAAAHKGTVLMELTDNNTVRFTMSIAVQNSKTISLHSPILLPTDYAGGKDKALLELSDVLPYQLFADID